MAGGIGTKPLRLMLNILEREPQGGSRSSFFRPLVNCEPAFPAAT